jgi:NAD(P)-dependent dehydrogenase (short-subunit alcohol dehydrogenase family)
MNTTENKMAVIVTGGGKGIGKAISLELSKTYRLVLVGRTERDLKIVCEAINVHGGQALYHVGDVAKQSTAVAVLQLIEKQKWKLHGVVCNAGIGKSSPTHELSADQWQEAFNVNVHGSFYFAQAALPLLMQQKSGVLCFINSLAGLKGYAYEAAYVASKHAVVGLAKTFALEYGKYGISSVVLCPSFVESDMTTRTINSLATRRGISQDEARHIVEKTNPQQRIISKQEIAEMVAFVCANTVPSLSGNPIILSGGA